MDCYAGDNGLSYYGTDYTVISGGGYTGGFQTYKEFMENGNIPTLRRIKNAGNVPIKELYALFPDGPAKKAAKIAGLGKPQGCV